MENARLGRKKNMFKRDMDSWFQEGAFGPHEGDQLYECVQCGFEWLCALVVVAGKDEEK